MAYNLTGIRLKNCSNNNAIGKQGTTIIYTARDSIAIKSVPLFHNAIYTSIIAFHNPLPTPHQPNSSRSPSPNYPQQLTHSPPVTSNVYHESIAALTLHRPSCMHINNWFLFLILGQSLD